MPAGLKESQIEARLKNTDLQYLGNPNTKILKHLISIVSEQYVSGFPIQHSYLLGVAESKNK